MIYNFRSVTNYFRRIINVFRQKPFYFLLLLLSLAVFIYSSGTLLIRITEYYRSKASFDKVKAIYKIPSDSDSDHKTNNLNLNRQEYIPDNSEKLSRLKEINNDLRGWIYIPLTKIDYPIVQNDNNDYYLDHNFTKEKSKYGCIFMDFHNSASISDPNIVLYGHNFGDDTMFSSLLSYGQQDFWDKHKFIYLDTLSGKTKWEVFSAYETSTQFNYLLTNFAGQEVYRKFLETITEKSYIKGDTNITPNDKILTLSTCSYSFENARFVVHAKLVNSLG